MVRVNFEERRLHIEANLDIRLGQYFARARGAHQDLMNRIRERTIIQDRLFADRIAANQAEILAEMPRPLFDLLNNLHNWDYIKAYLLRFRGPFATFLLSGSLVLLFRNCMVYMGPSGLFYVRSLVQNPFAVYCTRCSSSYPEWPSSVHFPNCF